MFYLHHVLICFYDNDGTVVMLFNKDFYEELKELIRIPSISFPGFDKAEVSRSAHAVENLLKKIAKKKAQHHLILRFLQQI